MKQIVLYTSGTLGDHLPFIALGRALADRGHRVTVAVNGAMAPWVEKAGLEAVLLTDRDRGPEEARENAWAWDHWNNPFSPDDARVPPFNFDRYITQVRELISLVAGADLFIATAIRDQGWLVHRATGTPWLTASLNAAAFAPEGKQEEGSAAEEKHRKAVEYFTEINNRALAALGIRGGVPPWRRGWLYSRHVLLASSPLFSLPDLEQLQPHSSIDMTGFWYWTDPEWAKWRPDDKLSAFCERRPLVLAFSSQPLEDPRRLLNMHVRAARLAGLPLLVQEGWAGFSREMLVEPDGDDLMFTGFLPQDWLFAKASASIQHGGVGSLARALRQGCPLLVEPFGNDQVFNAARVEQLVAGAALHPFRTSAEGIARALEEKVLSDECRSSTEELASALQEEGGLEEACRLVEIFLDRSGEGMTGHSGPAPYLGELEVPSGDIAPVSPDRVKEDGEDGEIEVKASLLLSGAEVSTAVLKVERLREHLAHAGKPPLVSCLMITADRAELARRAVHCFRLQTWPERELVVLDNGEGSSLGKWIGSLGDARISYHYFPREGRTLGELRNICAERASGQYLAVWDDDDLSAPHRLELQMGAVEVLAAQACLLERCTLWEPAARRMAHSGRRLWEPSLLCAADAIGRYPHLRKGEDTPAVERLVATGRVALLDAPALYVKVYHGENTWDSGHDSELWRTATKSIRRASYDREVRILEELLQLDFSRGA